jgi:hypothetical protein
LYITFFELRDAETGTCPLSRWHSGQQNCPPLYNVLFGGRIYVSFLQVKMKSRRDALLAC